MAGKEIFILLIMAGTVVVSEYCENLPEIRYSVNNMSGIHPYPEDISVQFSCLPEYRPEGNGIYKCLDGDWAGGPFSCIIKECPMLDSPKHGKKIGDSYKIGDVMRFKCDNGYELIGSNTSLCRTNSKWHPTSIPRCQIKKCPAVPSIEHGKTALEKAVNGHGGVYGAKLRVYCDNGYMLSGAVKIHCDANGQWTDIPKCKRVACPPYPGLDSKCVRSSKLELNNTLLTIRCTEQSTFFTQGDGIASCYNNKWDDLSMRCYCDCKVKANLHLVIIENVHFNGFLKHNVSLKWSCKNESKKSTNEPLICDDGLIGTPDCEFEILNDLNNDLNIGILVSVVCIPVLTLVIAFIIYFLFKKKKLRCSAKQSGVISSLCFTTRETGGILTHEQTARPMQDESSTVAEVIQEYIIHQRENPNTLAVNIDSPLETNAAKADNITGYNDKNDSKLYTPLWKRKVSDTPNDTTITTEPRTGSEAEVDEVDEKSSSATSIEVQVLPHASNATQEMDAMKSEKNATKTFSSDTNSIENRINTTGVFQYNPEAENMDLNVENQSLQRNDAQNLKSEILNPNANQLPNQISNKTGVIYPSHMPMPSKDSPETEDKKSFANFVYGKESYLARQHSDMKEAGPLLDLTEKTSERYHSLKLKAKAKKGSKKDIDSSDDKYLCANEVCRKRVYLSEAKYYGDKIYHEGCDFKSTQGKKDRTSDENDPRI